ncbi:MAG: hypothetical protein LBG52_02820 [Candidatus Peribacteria bacterium]|nr:hypothetical protein [Candidatus Peribacteria bacterium]
MLLSVVTGEVSIDNNCLDIHLKYPLSSWMDEKSSNGAGWRTTQTNCPLLPLTPSPEH